MSEATPQTSSPIPDRESRIAAPAPRAPRILMIAPTPFFADRGCHVRIYEEARALQELGCRVEICTYHLGDDRPGLTIHRTPRVPWYNKLEAGPSWHKLYVDLLLLARTWAVARRFRPDVLHGHLHEGVAIGWIVGRRLGVPLVGDFQGSLSGELKAHQFVMGRGWFYRFWAHNESRIDRLPEVAVASCGDVACELKERFGVRDVILALDGVDTGVFRPGVERIDPPAGSESLAPPGRQVVVYLGVLSAYQGVDHLLEAIPLVLARVPQAYFLVMGYPNVDLYRQKARDLGVIDHVGFPGRIDYDQAARYLALGQVAVGPKLSETESNGKLYNYMACALPVVAFDTPPSREILGDLGVYAPRGDVAALADGIAGLLEDPEAARRLGLSLRRRAVDNFSWQNTAQQLQRAYALALSKASAARSEAALPASPSQVVGDAPLAGKRDRSGRNRARDRLLNVLKIVVSLAGVLIVLLTQDLGQVFGLLRETSWAPFLGALFLFLVGVPLRAYRWGSLVWSLGVQASGRRLVALYFVGSFFNMFLPTGLGGDAIKMYELSRGDHKVAAAISSVLVDRFLGLFVLFALALLALIGSYELVAPQVRAFIALVFVGSLLAAVLLFQRTWLAAWGQRLGVDRLLGRFKILRELYDSIHLYSAAALLRACAASLVFDLILILGYYLLGVAVGFDLSVWYYFLFVPIISALLMLPSVGGLGIREGATVFLFQRVGVDSSRALALALAYDVTLLVIGLTGAVIYLVQSMQEARK
jgi:uncharacterized protein (TIRG00374 family)